jgi:hypothetical protein
VPLLQALYFANPMSRSEAAGPRMRALLLITAAAMCAESCVLCGAACPRPDADCFYAGALLRP